MKKIKLAVLFGGRSGEHEISLQSARSVIEALNPDRYEIIPVGITRAGCWLAGGCPLQALVTGDESHCSPACFSLDPVRPGLMLLRNTDGAPVISDFISLDAVFPILHGPYGEDGTVQGLFELMGLPYVGSGVLGSAVSMDKAIMKQLFEKADIPVTPYLFLNRIQWEKNKVKIIEYIESILGMPCFVKPSNMGSSVGVSKVGGRESLSRAVEEAFQYDFKVLVETLASGREIECSVLGNEHPDVSVAGEIIPCNEFYDYRAKYIDENSQLVIPAVLPEHLSERVRQLALQAFKTVEACGLARVDFFVDIEKGQVLVNEINTMPGFTSISMYPKLWEASGLSYPKLLDRLVELAFQRQARRRALHTDYHPINVNK